jgi:hypothetical protein
VAPTHPGGSAGIRCAERTVRGSGNAGNHGPTRDSLARRVANQFLLAPRRPLTVLGDVEWLHWSAEV